MSAASRRWGSRWGDERHVEDACAPLPLPALQDGFPHTAEQQRALRAIHAARLLPGLRYADEGGDMRKVSHFAIIAFLAACTALMAVLLLAQDDGDEFTYVTDECEEEEEPWS